MINVLTLDNISCLFYYPHHAIKHGFTFWANCKYISVIKFLKWFKKRQYYVLIQFQFYRKWEISQRTSWRTLFHNSGNKDRHFLTHYQKSRFEIYLNWMNFHNLKMRGVVTKFSRKSKLCQLMGSFPMIHRQSRYQKDAHKLCLRC